MARAVTEEKLEAALRVVRQWYFDEIRAIVKEAKEHEDGEDREAWLNQTIDGHEFVIYTYKARLVMICTDHPDAFEEEMGDKPETVEQAAYGAMMADVRDGL